MLFLGDDLDLLVFEQRAGVPIWDSSVSVPKARVTQQRITKDFGELQFNDFLFDHGGFKDRMGHPLALGDSGMNSTGCKKGMLTM